MGSSRVHVLLPQRSMVCTRQAAQLGGSNSSPPSIHQVCCCKLHVVARGHTAALVALLLCCLPLGSSGLCS